LELEEEEEELKSHGNDDSIFYYRTAKTIRIVDRYIGLVFYALGLLILLYFGIYVFYLQRNYYNIEQTKGGSAVTPIGTFLGVTSSGQTTVFDATDLTRVQAETSAIFIGTSYSVTPL
jgi:hypothetical protein